MKDFRKKYKKAVDTAKRSGGGRTVACFFDILFSLRFGMDVPPQQVLVMAWIQPILESL